MLNRLFMPLLILLTTILLSGCAISPIKLTSKIDSRAVIGAQNYKTYWLLPGQKNIKTSDLAYREYSRYVDITLKQTGFIKAREQAKANVIIFLSYGTGKPRNYFYTENRTVIARPDIFDLDYNDSFADTDYISQLQSEIVYNRYIKMSAYQGQRYNKNKQLEPLWSVQAMSVGQSNDLRELFPYILVSMTPYIAVDSLHQVMVNINNNDPQVQQLIIQNRL